MSQVGTHFYPSYSPLTSPLKAFHLSWGTADGFQAVTATAATTVSIPALRHAPFQDDCNGTTPILSAYLPPPLPFALLPSTLRPTFRDSVLIRSSKTKVVCLPVVFQM